MRRAASITNSNLGVASTTNDEIDVLRVGVDGILTNGKKNIIGALGFEGDFPIHSLGSPGELSVALSIVCLSTLLSVSESSLIRVECIGEWNLKGTEGVSVLSAEVHVQCNDTICASGGVIVEKEQSRVLVVANNNVGQRATGCSNIARSGSDTKNRKIDREGDTGSCCGERHRGCEEWSSFDVVSVLECKED